MRDDKFRAASNSAYVDSIVGNSNAPMDRLSPRSEGSGGGSMFHCVCGLPMRADQETCD